MTLNIKVTMLCLCLLFLTGQAPLAIPISVPIKFGVDKSIEFSVLITKHRNYYLDLVFNFKDSAERAEARKLAGDVTRLCAATKDCGEASSFIVSINAQDEVIFKEVRRVYGYYAHSDMKFWRNIIIVPLRPNKYKINVEISEDTGTMSSANTTIELTTDPREQDLGG